MTSRRLPDPKNRSKGMSETHRVSIIAKNTLKWYALNQRDLPWRRTRNAYHIWVSEVMLQQTQVETVRPFYHRFLKYFPTIGDLADASIQEVLKVWENMGYYSRARRLRASALQLMKSYGGKVPETREELLALPGIGDYTASAILCFAFGQALPTVDGNLRRIISRLFAIQSPLGEAPAERRIRAIANELVLRGEPSNLNQGLMDLGATVCRPGRPLCPACPNARHCLGLERGLQEVLPVTAKKGPLPHRDVTAGIICDEKNRVLIVQRPFKGLLGGLWKFPGGMRGEGEDLSKTLQNSIERELGIQVADEKFLGSVKHAYTHFRITLHAFRCSWKGGSMTPRHCEQYQWISKASFPDYPFSKADRKIMAFL